MLYLSSMNFHHNTCMVAIIVKFILSVKYIQTYSLITSLPTSLIRVWDNPRIPELIRRLRLLDWCSETRIPSMARIKRD